MSTHLPWFHDFSAFCHHFVLTKLANSSLRVNAIQQTWIENKHNARQFQHLYSFVNSVQWMIDVVRRAVAQSSKLFICSETYRDPARLLSISIGKSSCLYKTPSPMTNQKHLINMTWTACSIMHNIPSHSWDFFLPFTENHHYTEFYFQNKGHWLLLKSSHYFKK